jgi:flagellar assembly protein FliH
LASTFAPSTRIIKQPSLAGDVYPVMPAPTRHDRAYAIALVRDAEERANAILAEAQQESSAILIAAQEERDTQIEAMRLSILAEAQREVLRKMQEEQDQTALRFRQLVEQAQIDREGLRAACYADVLALAVAVAERVIGRELRADPELVEQIAGTALSQVQLEQITHVMVHPNNYAVMERWAAEALGAQRARIAIVTDPAVGEGGCVIGTKTGFVDARIETQLAVVRRTLAEVVDNA